MSQKVFFKGWADFSNLDFKDVVPTWFVGDIDLIDATVNQGTRTISALKMEFQVNGINDYNPDYACPIMAIVYIKQSSMSNSLRPIEPLQQRYIDYSMIPQSFIVTQGLINHRDKTVITFNGKCKLNSNQSLAIAFLPISVWYVRQGSGTEQDPYIYDFLHHYFSVYWCGEYLATY